MMLGKQSPWSIVYPTLVDVNANQDKQSEELQQILSCLVASHFYSFSAASLGDYVLNFALSMNYSSMVVHLALVAWSHS